MATIIYPSPIFGPVRSRRLGVSLGINLMPADGKVCSFDCIYCECGFNADHRPTLPRPTREQVADALEAKLREMAATGERPDVLTFAGTGEPTGHPQFADIINDTLRLRDRHCPSARVSVLSNGTLIGRDSVREALMRVDNNIVKLDTVDNAFIRAVDRPASPSYDAARVVEQMKWFEGHVIVQTMFLKGPALDNTTEAFVAPWLQAVEAIAPQSVMIYTIDRETPFAQLEKASKAELDRIRDLVVAEGIPCSASY